MPFSIIRNDITNVKAEAIVNAANTDLIAGGGVDGAIHRAAGSNLKEELKKYHGCAVGKAVITSGCNMSCKYIIHAVGPIYCGGFSGEKDLLKQAYKSSLSLVKQYKIKSVAFPLISTGAYAYPMGEAVSVAVEVIRDFLTENDDVNVTLVVFDSEAFRIGCGYGEIASYIDEKLAYEREESVVNKHRRYLAQKQASAFEECCEFALPAQCASDENNCNLADRLKTLDESFSQTLFRLIDERQMSDSECYKRANVDRKLFSKIRGNVNYHPSKPTAVAFAIALGLNIDEARALLGKAGFTLTHSSKADIIIEYFIENGVYDIITINEALFAFDQSLLG